MKLSISLILSSLFLNCCLQNRKPFDFQHANIKSVIFRNHQFEFRKNLKTESEIAEFKSLERVTEIPQNYGENWTHKIDIEAADDDRRVYSGRWLYDSHEGSFAHLNYELKPRFQLKNYREFNEYLIRIGVVP
ncbi:hypothetical protein LEP1GSC046_0200 [Leptospira kirschneri serovar Bim str. 1051]|uniref:hypothetical protein n=1 Tax=Leptospira kirschneri TaxID=29507 RepID=UPI00028893C2|nr:hypothetical protein [Leptospira kirschneri]EMK12167.1 hypothetical protein LEP1GSC042_1589 [Leptospira kirschneri serovar Bim str. PUO 1247]EMN05830.1 hypothetical protein LEP1GSC046_0200 [Leptospira kirschneri serovar Bim str. 1051]